MTLSATAVQGALGLLSVAAVLAIVRLVRGPTLPDRVIAFDVLTLVVLAMICGTAILTGRSLFLDAAIILALLSFLATVAFARAIERRVSQESGGDLPA